MGLLHAQRYVTLLRRERVTRRGSAHEEYAPRYGGNTMAALVTLFTPSAATAHQQKGHECAAKADRCEEATRKAGSARR